MTRAHRPDEDRGADGLVYRGQVDGVSDFIFYGVRRLWNEELADARCFMFGPRWRQHFDVQQLPIEIVRPPWLALASSRRRWVLMFSFEHDVRELVTQGGARLEARTQLRPGVFAEWED